MLTPSSGKRKSVLVIVITSSRNHLSRAVVANDTWGRACREQGDAITGPLFFSDAVTPEFAPTVVKSFTGTELYGDLFARVLAVLKKVVETPGVVESHAWVARAFDDQWVSPSPLLALVAQFDSEKPLAIGLLGSFRGPDLPHVLWGGGIVILSRATMRILRDGGIDFCWSSVLGHSGREANNMGDEDVWLTKCLELLGVRLAFGEGIFQGSSSSLNFIPKREQWAACHRRVVLGREEGRDVLLLEGDSLGGGMAGTLPVSFHYQTREDQERTFKAMFQTPCREVEQAALDAEGGWPRPDLVPVMAAGSGSLI